jgi:hypothetical protein
VGRLAVVAGLVLPSRVGAQLPPIGVPGGVVRVELDGTLETFERRFRQGRLESYAADLSSTALGSDRIPILADGDARIGRIIGNASYRLNLGGSTSDAHADVGSGFLGVSLGLTNFITIFGRIPLVRSRVQSSMQLDPTSADAGLNPGEADQVPFFTELDAALATLSAKLAAGDYDADPSQRALAQTTLTDGTALRADLFGLLADPATASPALPTSGSVAGSALNGRIVTLQTTLTNDLSVPGFTLTPALPATPMTEAELEQLLSSPPVSIRLDQSSTTFRGDAEVGAAVTLIDRWDRGNRRGGLRTALAGTVRLPTGRRELSDRPLDLGTGDVQTDLQIEVVTDVGAGPLGARLQGTYVRQFPSNSFTRVTSPSQPFAGPDRLTMARRDRGDIVGLGVHPFYRLARTFGLTAGVEHWSRGSDVVTYASTASAIPGIDPSILAEESKSNATLLSLGITYANPGGLRPGGKGLPVDASWSYQRVLRAGGGRVPDTHAVRGQFRVYFGVW